MKHFLTALTCCLLLGACAPAPENPAPDAPPAAKRMPMEWIAEEFGAGNDAVPSATLMLKVAGTGEELYRTTCTGAPSRDVQDMEESIASIQCWWAGGGWDPLESTCRHASLSIL